MRDQLRRYPDNRVRKERSSFVLLQHLYSLSQELPGPLSARRLAAELGFTIQEEFACAKLLARTGLAKWDEIDQLTLTRAGRDYIERDARRRRSVRLPAEELSGSEALRQ